MQLAPTLWSFPQLNLTPKSGHPFTSAADQRQQLDEALFRRICLANSDDFIRSPDGPNSQKIPQRQGYVSRSDIGMLISEQLGGVMREIVEGTIVGGEQLWKYFRPERFISMLAENQIYFASANQFNDRFEGAVAVQSLEQEADPRYAEMEPAERAFFELKRLTKISCWHRASYESDAMWKLYAGEHKGIAICTTPVACAELDDRLQLSTLLGRPRFA